MSLIRTYLLLLLLAVFKLHLSAQCITSFPHTQDFEASNGNWTPGGTASDWSWGTPIKPVINGAASGTKCWIVGTLTQSSYTNNQNSTLTSPCFDFSGLTIPYIRFKIFWETEKKYDGATFQFSTDGGTNWTTVGAYSDFQSCPSDNWFNTNTVTALGMDGWSGNIQPTASCAGGAGNGSGQWKLAQHELYELAGKPNVRFRFRFAAGSVCNNYDGFAVDDIWIGDFSFKTPNFSYTCQNSNSVKFEPEGSACNPIFDWNFGDPASGASNTSNQFSPTHTFSGPGTYTVTLTIQIATIVPPVIRKVTITDINTVIITPLDCHGDKATLETQVNPPGNYSYHWNSTPVQTTPILSNVPAGTYTVTVSADSTCTNTDQVSLTQPLPVKTFLGNDTVLCSGESLLLDAGNFTGYLWQDGSTGRTFKVSQSGTYFVRVMDNNDCEGSDTIKITVDCSDIYFPSAFTPNKDGLNDSFGALGNIQGVGNYTLRIFNRWGQLIFQTTDPSKTWNGAIQGKLVSTNSYTFSAEYTLKSKNIKRLQKGTITVISDND